MEDKPPRILEVGEVTALMNVATELQQKTAISVVYYHGLRRDELSRLRWEDIDLDECKLRIARKPRSKTRVTRAVALRHETAAPLSQLKAEQVNEYVFEKPKTFYWVCGKWFGQLVEEAGLDHCSIHDLRKTCNTLMKDAGVPPEAAMQVLGHTTAKINRVHYTGPLSNHHGWRSMPFLRWAKRATAPFTAPVGKTGLYKTLGNDYKSIIIQCLMAKALVAQPG